MKIHVLNMTHNVGQKFIKIHYNLATVGYRLIQRGPLLEDSVLTQAQPPEYNTDNTHVTCFVFFADIQLNI